MSGEFLTPLFPHMFLPLASLANLGKAVALSAFVAVTPSFQHALCKGSNLADITAKNQAQVCGSTGCGVGYSTWGTRIRCLWCAACTCLLEGGLKGKGGANARYGKKSQHVSQSETSPSTRCGCMCKRHGWGKSLGAPLCTSVPLENAPPTLSCLPPPRMPLSLP